MVQSQVSCTNKWGTMGKHLCKIEIRVKQMCNGGKWRYTIYIVKREKVMKFQKI